jgi:hypothetical protein
MNTETRIQPELWDIPTDVLEASAASATAPSASTPESPCYSRYAHLPLELRAIARSQDARLRAEGKPCPVRWSSVSTALGPHLCSW